MDAINILKVITKMTEIERKETDGWDAWIKLHEWLLDKLNKQIDVHTNYDYE